jgi:hypothetical protein
MVINENLERNKELRMFGLVPYNISPIQQAIQFGHAVVEYGLLYFNDPQYQEWAKKWKTFIILNGGTTNTSGANPGSLNMHNVTLDFQGVKKATFHEPDLGDQMTAIVFVVDERVFNKTLYPDYEISRDGTSREIEDFSKAREKGHELDLESLETWRKWKYNFSQNEKEAERIIFLRSFLKNFRLA